MKKEIEKAEDTEQEHTGEDGISLLISVDDKEENDLNHRKAPYVKQYDSDDDVSSASHASKEVTEPIVIKNKSGKKN